MYESSIDDLKWVIEELDRVKRQLRTGIPGPGVLATIDVKLETMEHVIISALDRETTDRRRVVYGPNGGNCGWCGEHVDGDVFKHVQKCRKGWEQEQAARLQQTTDALRRLAQDLEAK